MRPGFEPKPILLGTSLSQYAYHHVLQCEHLSLGSHGQILAAGIRALYGRNGVKRETFEHLVPMLSATDVVRGWHSAEEAFTLTKPTGLG